VAGMITMSVLDSPLTIASTTYNVYLATETTSGSVYLNRTQTDSDSAGGAGTRAASTLTLMEIQA